MGTMSNEDLVATLLDAAEIEGPGTMGNLLKLAAERLLKEQEPLIIKKDDVDEVYDYMAKCPECGMIWAMWYSERMRYCPGCGRKVKWDE